MSEPNVIVTGQDTWVSADSPNMNRGDTDVAWVRTGDRRTLLRVGMPNLTGETVISAILYGTIAGDAPAQQYSLGLLSEPWAEMRVTWNNQPGVSNPGGQFIYSEPGALSGGDKVAFNVTSHLQAIADGDYVWRGWRVGTSSATGARFHTFNSGNPAWELHIVLASDVDAASELRPDGGAVNGPTPVLSWEYDDQAAFRIQVDTPPAGMEPDEVAPDYDSGWVSSSETQAGGGEAAEVVTNLSTTPSFEVAEDWVAVSGSADPVRSQERAAEGSWSLKCARGAGTNVAIGRRSTFGNLLPGAGTYTLGMDVWVDPVVVGDAGVRLSGSGMTTAYGLATTRGGWETVYATFTWDGASNIFLDAYDAAMTADALIYLDKMVIVAGSQPVPYFDGDTPDDSDYAYAWTGSPGASTSTRTTVTGYPPRVGAGPHYWRVQTRADDGGEAEWSQWADFTVDPHPALVIDAPTGEVGDPEVDVYAHLASGNIGSWYVWATGPNREDVRWRSGRRTGPVQVQVPHRNKDGRRVFRESGGGWLYVHVADDVDRAVAVGEQAFADAWIKVEFADKAAVAPTNLTVTNMTEGHPRLRWEWDSTDVAETWLIQVDGDTIARVDGDELTPVEGHFTWYDGGEVSPLRPHTLAVRAVDSQRQRSTAARLDYVHVVEGMWVKAPGENWFVLDGTAVDGFVHTDRVATYEPIDGPPVDVIYDWLGKTGTFEGSVDDRDGAAKMWATLDSIENLRTSHRRTCRLVWGSHSIRARLRHPSSTSAGDMMPSDLTHVVRFDFYQVGD